MLRPSQLCRRWYKRSISNNFRGYQRVQGPTFFSDPNTVPPPYSAPQSPMLQDEIPQAQHEESKTSSASRRSFKDLASFIAMATLAFFALDNYQGRLKAEKLNQETTAINLKTLQIQQHNYLQARKQQDLKNLKERVEVSKRCFKMSMHIALLRKQLLDLGIEPKVISDVLEEFDKKAKVSNSVQNLTGNALWLNDDTDYKGLMPDYKGLMPDYREYDRKT